MRGIFGHKRDEWRRLHNKEPHAVYSSPNIIRVIKSRRLKWAGHVKRMGETINACKVLVGKPEVKNLLDRQMIILKWIFKKWDGQTWAKSIWLRILTGGGLL
jgi:hypothetical protein